MIRKVLLILCLLAALMAVAWVGFIRPWYDDYSKSDAVDATEVIRDTLELSVLDVQVSQIFEVNRDNLALYTIPIPFTSQKSLIVAKGEAKLGYDVDGVVVERKLQGLSLHLPKPEVLSLDLDFHFVFEKDSILNRISPQDRTKMLQGLKARIRQSLSTERYQEKVQKRTLTLLESVSKAMATKLDIVFD